MNYTVIAWIEPNGKTVLTDGYERPDGVNWKRKVKLIDIPRAVVWISNVSEAALVSAREYADTLEYQSQVFQFRNEANPLETAKKEVMKLRSEA